MKKINCYTCFNEMDGVCCLCESLYFDEKVSIVDSCSNFDPIEEGCEHVTECYNFPIGCKGARHWCGKTDFTEDKKLLAKKSETGVYSSCSDGATTILHSQGEKNMERKTTKTKKQIEYVTVDSFKVLKAREMKNSDNVSFDLVLNGITIYGCFVIAGKNGDFISLPQRAGTDGKYYSIVWAPLSDDDQKAIIAEVEKVLND